VSDNLKMNIPERVCVGAVVGAFGINGEIRIKSFCSVPKSIGDYDQLTDETGSKKFKLEIIGPIKGGFSARIFGIKYRDQAEDLKGTALYVLRSEMPDLGDDEYYYSDLINLSVFDTGGIKLGKIMSVNDHGAGDFLEIKALGQKNLALLPFTKKSVPTIDLKLGRVVIDPPKGVFDSDEAEEPPAPKSYMELGDE